MMDPTLIAPDTNSSAHRCIVRPEGHIFHYGGNCWCQPRSLCTAMLHQSLRATDARLRPANVVALPLRPAGRRKVAL